MALRFLDTEYFKHPFVSTLQAPYKILYIFIMCDCDNTGTWNPNFEISSIYIGQKVDKKITEKFFEGKFIKLENGKWFFPDFIQHQYPKGLQNKNPAHTKIIEKLSLLGFLDDNNQVKGALKGLGSPFKGTKVKVIDKVEDKVEDNTPHLFINSEYIDFEKFKNKIESHEKYICFDIEFYHESIKIWSANKKLKIDWIATAKGFMLRDLKDGKPKLKKEYEQKFKQDGKQSYDDKIREYLNRERNY
ncbi:hypothetical protein LCGC14_1345560 [marine sediment metagenome]|uniref:Uncharacterized protein n=1 Tax=marine sediment metagenome TaxID=412755 RepID=A0A0F9KYH7_9ZZZZ